MADGSFGKRNIDIDLNSPITARVIRDATKGEWVKVDSIFITGTAPATGTEGTIIIREESASGNILFKFVPTNSQVLQIFPLYDSGPAVVKGLYMDAMTTGWVAGSLMVINTR